MIKPLSLKLLGLFAIIASLTILIWGFDKAFDFTDAGYYLLRYQDIQPIEFGGHMYEHVLVRTILPQSLRTVIPLRFIGLFINILSSGFLAFAITKVIKHWLGQTRVFPSVFFLVFAGLIFSYAGSPSELSYNTLNQFFLITGASLLVLATGTSEKHKLVYSALAGAVLSLCMLTKLPTGIGVVFIGGALILLSGKKRGWSLLAFCLAWGAVLGAVALLVKPSFVTYYANFYLSLSKYIVYDSNLLLKSILNIATLNINVLIIAAVVNLVILRSHKTAKPALEVLFMLLALCVTLYFVTERIVDHVRGAMLLSDFLMFLVYLALLNIAIFNPEDAFRGVKGCWNYVLAYHRYVAIVVLLLFLPYLGALGTSNSLNWGAKYYYPAVMGGLAMITISSGSGKVQKLSLALAFYLIVMGLFQYIEYPYRSKPLYLQNNDYKGIKYDIRKWTFLQQTETILKRHRFMPEQGIITVYKAPGLVYLNESFQPGSILWSEESEDLYFAILGKSTVKLKPVVISMGKELSAEFVGKLNASMKMDFSKDYRLVEAYPNYDGCSKVFVYFPILP
jgi:hypothetical protein